MQARRATGLPCSLTFNQSGCRGMQAVLSSVALLSAPDQSVSRDDPLDPFGKYPTKSTLREIYLSP